MKRLVLFDVDGTLIKRGDPDHLAAMDHGVHSEFPAAREASVVQIDFDGKVDRLIASEILARAGIDVSSNDARLGRVFNVASDYYRQQWLERDLGREDLLPGVAELISALADSPDEFALGVLTGGSREIVAVKLERLGLADYFPVGAFGDEVPDRPSLVPLALRRAEDHYGEGFGPDRSVIVGDTPHDVRCAHEHGLPCLGVATGKYSEAELREARADEVVSDLSRIEPVIDHLRNLTLKSA